MTLLLMEGFDSLASTHDAGISELLASYGWVDVNRAQWFDSARTRTGRGGCLSWALSTAGGSSGQGWAFVPHKNNREIIVGVAAWYSSNRGYENIWRMQYDNLRGTVYDQIKIYHNDVNGITVLNGNDELIAYSDPNVIFGDTWNYLEIKAKAGLTDGEIIVKVNGCTVIAATGIKTMHGSAAAFYNRQGPGYFSWSTSPNARFDDLYICDTQGSDFNDFLGDVVIEDLLPVGDTAGPTNGMVVVGTAGGHFAAVDEIPPDGDTTYLTTNDNNIIERFEASELPADVIDVLAVQVSAYTRREGTAYKSFRAQVTVGASTSEGEDKFAASSYTEQGTIFTQVPGGSGWTVADVNSMQIGIRTTS